MVSAAACILAVLLDAALGEPRRWHPLVGFGQLADWIEKRLNHARPYRLLSGCIASLILIIPSVLLAALLLRALPAPLVFVAEILVVYLALGLRSLGVHAGAVASALAAGDLDRARVQVARMVSRRCEELDENGIATAATESTLENGSDAVFATLFWFLLAGLPGVVLHRLVNTLDAMWGYRTPRFNEFGRFIARLDDLLNWPVARLTALTYALTGQTRTALRCWQRQAHQWQSPNAGPVMSAGAGALGLRLGDAARYADGWHQRPVLGAGDPPAAEDIRRAVTLIYRGVGLWLLLILAGGIGWNLIMAVD